MKFTATVLASVAVMATANNLREAVEAELHANDPVCNTIYGKQWWSDRQEQKKKGWDATTLDGLCSYFNGDAAQCNQHSARPASTPSEYKDIRCQMIGAHNHTCVGVPCFDLNSGDCTLQNTAGECVWFTNQDVKDENAYFNKNNDPRHYAGHGCYRNPCNQPGYGKLSASTCEGFSTLNYKCTWCKGKGVLRGEGMGCQIKNMVETTAECAFINNVPKDQQQYIVWEKANHKCQLNILYNKAAEIYDGPRSNQFEPRKF
mmetsp:Transcript_67339/g.147552  ORF Transcript_67339/g.147552 Transcript_67339/m.147552 type:complete len:260 (-) Transcript_67339:47-826(-)